MDTSLLSLKLRRTLDVRVEGESGILGVHPKDFRPQYEPSKRRLTWPNGARATLFNATEPDQLRGPQHSLAWCDELAKWQYAEETWDQLQFGMRLGKHPRPSGTLGEPVGMKSHHSARRRDAGAPGHHSAPINGGVAGGIGRRTSDWSWRRTSYSREAEILLSVKTRVE
jgi:Terminase large subunit, T4likevirus-type, N-terminal